MKTKRAWEMTYGEFMEGTPPRTPLAATKNTIHRQVVKEAFEQGKPVPVEVLADYPELSNQNAVNTNFQILILDTAPTMWGQQ